MFCKNVSSNPMLYKGTKFSLPDEALKSSTAFNESMP